MTIKTALISASDKTGLIELAKALREHGVQIYSTGGTAQLLKENDCPVFSVNDFTGFGELAGGRVKSLHPRIYAGILANLDDPEQVDELKKLKLPKIDLVVTNFYPFEKVVNKQHIHSEAIDNIDVGGPSMLRAAAKNYQHTWVLSDPKDYPLFISSINQKDKASSLQYRKYLATKAFCRVAELDMEIANYFSADVGDLEFAEDKFIHLKKVTDLPYGENPHQRAACYTSHDSRSGFTQLQGTPASYNNLLDTTLAYHVVSQFEEPTAIIVKHNNPCGMASAKTIKEAFVAALRCDTVSAYGGIIAFNRELDEETASKLNKCFCEVVAAPQFSSEAKTIFALKNRLRLLIPSMPEDDSSNKTYQMFGHRGLFLIESLDFCNNDDYKVATIKEPSKNEMSDLKFAWKAAASVKSNAIVIAKDNATIGIGAGQMSRIDSAWLACEKAKRAKINIKGAVAASDGFFPFTDGLEELTKAGITAIIQPGGSKNDNEVIRVANECGIAMVMTGSRHFLH